jgi:hypothetical protein
MRINKKLISFGEWKTQIAARIIDLGRRIHILRQAGHFANEELKTEARRAAFKKHAEKMWLESILRRASENDTVDIIARDMKRKALRDIRRFEK